MISVILSPLKLHSDKIAEYRIVSKIIERRRLKNGLSVLVVDGVELTRLELDDNLHQESNHKQVVDDGQRVLKEQGANVLDIMLMDIQMPIITGYETTRSMPGKG